MGVAEIPSIVCQRELSHGHLVPVLVDWRFEEVDSCPRTVSPGVTLLESWSCFSGIASLMPRKSSLCGFVCRAITSSYKKPQGPGPLNALLAESLARVRRHYHGRAFRIDSTPRPLRCVGSRASDAGPRLSRRHRIAARLSGAGVSYGARSRQIWRQRGFRLRLRPASQWRYKGRERIEPSLAGRTCIEPAVSGSAILES